MNPGDGAKDEKSLFWGRVSREIPERKKQTREWVIYLPLGNKCYQGNKWDPVTEISVYERST